MYTYNGVGQPTQLSDLLKREQKQLKGDIASLEKEIASKQAERLEKEKRLVHIEALLDGKRRKKVQADPAPVSRTSNDTDHRLAGYGGCGAA